MTGCGINKLETSGKLSRLTSIFVVLFLVVLASYQLLERVPIYNDETINTFKGYKLHIFDYSVRPIYFSINALFIHLLGDDIKSLQICGLVFFVVSGYLVFLIGRFYSLYCSLTALCLYSLYSNQWLLGMQGMPHSPLSTILLLVIFTIFITRDNSSSFKSNFFKGILVFLPILTHPTSIGFVAGFSCCYVISLFFRVSFISALWSSLFFSLGKIFTIALTEIVFRQTIGISFIGSWVNGFDKVQVQPQYQHYYKPFNYYWTIIWAEYSYLILLPVLVIIGLIIIKGQAHKTRLQSNNALVSNKTVSIKIDQIEDRFNLTACFFILFGSTVVSIFAISLANWKFDRVLAGFTPLIALNVAISLYFFTSYLKPGLSKLVKLFTIITIITLGIHKFSIQTRTLLKNSFFSYNNYQSAIDLLRSLPTQKFGYFGTARNFYQGNLHAIPARKKLVRLDAEQFSTLSTLSFVSELDRQNLSYFIVNTQLPKNVKLGIMQAATSPYCNQIYDYIGSYQVWHCRKYPLDNPVVRRLRILAKGTKVALPKSQESTRLAKLLKSLRLSPVIDSNITNSNILKVRHKFILVDDKQRIKLEYSLDKFYKLLAEDHLLDSSGYTNPFFLYRKLSNKNIKQQGNN